MRTLRKPDFKTADILDDCKNSYRSSTREGIKNKIELAKNEIITKSDSYDEKASKHDWSFAIPHTNVVGILSKDDMVDIYESKFVKTIDIRKKYYNVLISSAHNGTCPICNYGEASTLDHYLAKTIYPTYAVTPYNLIPMCRDCNTNKSDSVINPENAPLHPYYDDVDSVVWLEAKWISVNQGYVVKYSVSEQLKENDVSLYERLVSHMKLYRLNTTYSTKASTELAEYSKMWGSLREKCGDSILIKLLQDTLSSLEQNQKNTWKTAMYRALIKKLKSLN